jgi:hypothetical protein
MGDHLIASVTSIAVAIVGVAIIAVLVSRNANTSGVIGAAGQAFAGALGAAEAPVTGSSAAGGFGLNTFTGGGVGYSQPY